MKVLFFGPLAEIAGSSFLEWEACTSTEKLRQQLIAGFPGLATKGFKIAVNQKLVEGDTTIQDGDELAILAPFSGG